MPIAKTASRAGFALLLSLGFAAGCSTKDGSADCCHDCCAAPTTAPATKPAAGAATKPSAAAPATQKTEAAAAWKDLFDGKTLTHWKVADYAGKGDPAVEDGLIILPSGEGLTGVTWKGEALPKTNYEIEVVAKRIDGVDFFCGITFPVNDTFATLVTGGWGGAVVGISSLDDEDAAHNETTVYEKFEKGKFYTFKVRVEPENITAWIDAKEVVNVSIKDKKVSIRGDIDQSTPLGLASWQTTSGIKSVKVRKLEAGK
ncbi:3-keto-disaccharide hydrolase [Humisphaera borealis]|uniref:DUF1080 domain-containing protein n=1 Tax=Humisphaera borealis TaxID=2807512 RepID=A0A7M2X328_9BACT|nr:DUF1080 domain-containing protein [Humisphaera borealis]QOV91431.1 DUF1080 domain-containing protein [Humisphaera borealis]